MIGVFRGGHHEDRFLAKVSLSWVARSLDAAAVLAVGCYNCLRSLVYWTLLFETFEPIWFWGSRHSRDGSPL